MGSENRSNTETEQGQQWQNDFSRHGYAIIKSAISPERAAYYRDKQLAWLESFGLGFDKKNKKTWRGDCVPVNFRGGIYSLNCVGHEKFMWEARLEPGIIRPFQDLWHTTALLVSFDGMNVTPPQTAENDIRSTPWPHTDQHRADRDFLCAQGLLNTGPCGPNDGGLIVVEGSAPLWNEYWASDAGKAKSAKLGGTTSEQETSRRKESSEDRDLTKFTENELEWFTQRGCTTRKLLLDPGDLVIWDSRTIHYNCAPSGSELRSAMYLCYGPADMATPENIERKVGCFYGFQGTTHWPHTNVRSVHKSGGPERERPMEMHEWTQELLKLAGVEPYEVL
jgi:hypothetical protein